MEELQKQCALWAGRQARLFNYRLVARSLNEARREAAQRTADSISELERDGVLNADEPPLQRLIDRRALRGWPVAGRGINGAIAGSQPGTGPLFDDE